MEDKLCCNCFFFEMGDRDFEDYCWKHRNMINIFEQNTSPCSEHEPDYYYSMRMNATTTTEIEQLPF